jgi:peptidoglycan/LPS O-acetylase OafA/YrhL
LLWLADRDDVTKPTVTPNEEDFHLAFDSNLRDPKAVVVRIPSLDGIRALSFALVFAGHAGLNWIVPTTFGVTVFFFLSGFLITTLLRTELESTGTVSLKGFYLRRALRILPPFYVAFAFVFLLSTLAVVPPASEPPSMAAVLFHFSNYYIVQHDNEGFLTGTGVYWSLAVEEHFYLVFPCLYLAVTRIWKTPRAHALSLVAICLLVLAWRSVLVVVGHTSELRTSVATDTRFDSLLFGCILGLVENPVLDKSVLPPLRWKLLFFLGLGGLLLSFVVRNEVFRETVRYDLQGVSLIPIFVCAVRYPTWLPIRPLNFKPIALIGACSYSMYLVHLTVLGVLSATLGAAPWPLAVPLLGLVLTFGLAALMYKCVENPCAALRRQLRVDRLSPPRLAVHGVLPRVPEPRPQIGSYTSEAV